MKSKRYHARVCINGDRKWFTVVFQHETGIGKAIKEIVNYFPDGTIMSVTPDISADNEAYENMVHYRAEMTIDGKLESIEAAFKKGTEIEEATRLICDYFPDGAVMSVDSL